MKNLIVDFNNKIQAIKPMHGVNNGTVTNNFRFDATPWFRDAGIPYSRLHNTEYPFGGGEFVDINCIFKNFCRNPEDPAAYNFATTDSYLHHIIDAGTKIIYRLGSSIEHQATKRHIYPPKDYLKWAQVCEHIIRHFNEGWANGQHFNIQYWEIWNEPDSSYAWAGTQSDFFEFYRIVSTYLKQKFPAMKFGGPAMAMPSGPYAEAFFTYLTSFKPHVPLDFYSWHTYASSINEIISQSENVSKLLKKYEYSNCISILDEWNYVESWNEVGRSWDVIQSMKGAAFNAAILIALQNSTCDIAAYYDAQMSPHQWWKGLFAPGESTVFFQGAEPVIPRKGYFAFKAFNALYSLGIQTAVSCDADDIYALAASNGKSHAVLLSNYRNKDAESVTLQSEFLGYTGGACKMYVLNEDSDLQQITTPENVPKRLILEPNTVLLIEFQRTSL